jgi:hypothetical protein
VVEETGDGGVVAVDADGDGAGGGLVDGVDVFASEEVEP